MLLGGLLADMTRGDKEADGTSGLGLVPPIRIERTTNGLGM